MTSQRVTAYLITRRGHVIFQFHLFIEMCSILQFIYSVFHQRKKKKQRCDESSQMTCAQSYKVPKFSRVSTRDVGYRSSPSNTTGF